MDVFTVTGRVPARIQISSRNFVEQLVPKIEQAIAGCRPASVQRTFNGVRFEMGARTYLPGRFFGLAGGEIVVQDTATPVTIDFELKLTPGIALAVLVLEAGIVGSVLVRESGQAAAISAGTLVAVGAFLMHGGIANSVKTSVRRVLAAAVGSE